MQTRDDIHKIKQAMECACQSNAANLAILDSIEQVLKNTYTVTLNTNWTSVVGNNIVYTYYTGVAPGNPSGDTNNVETAKFFAGATLQFTQTFAYNGSNNCISIITA
jgi:hypothetical protein